MIVINVFGADKNSDEVEGQNGAFLTLDSSETPHLNKIIGQAIQDERELERSELLEKVKKEEFKFHLVNLIHTYEDELDQHSLSALANDIITSCKEVENVYVSGFDLRDIDDFPNDYSITISTMQPLLNQPNLMFITPVVEATIARLLEQKLAKLKLAEDLVVFDDEEDREKNTKLN